MVLTATRTMGNVTARKAIEAINARALALRTVMAKAALRSVDVKTEENAITSPANVTARLDSLAHCKTSPQSLPTFY